MLSTPMPFNKMSSMLVDVLVGWGGSEDFSRSMSLSDDVTTETSPPPANPLGSAGSCAIAN